MVGREQDEIQDQHLKRKPQPFLVEIQRRFPEPKAYGPDWHRRDDVRGLVAIYYVALRAVLRNKPWLRRYLVRCRHCWIFFLTDPRNAGREDLGCPFGCKDLLRRQSSTKRSTEHNASAAGKWKRHQAREARRLAAALAAAEASEAQEARCAAMLAGAHEAVPPSVEEVPPEAREDLPPPLRQPLLGVSDSATTVAETAAPERAMPSIGVQGDGPPRGLTPHRGDGLERAEAGDGEHGAGILRYVRAVVSLIEARRVSMAEVIEMLERTKRQHSFARERRIDYVLRRLAEEPEKPP